MKRRAPWIVLVVLLMIIGSGFIPTGYDVLFAGNPFNLDEFVQYEGGSELDGDLGMTYVASLQNSKWPIMILTHFSKKGVEIVPSVTGQQDLGFEELDYQNKIMMEQSKIKAEYIARGLLGEEPKLELQGFYPVYYFPDWKNKDAVKVTDILVGIDGEKLESYEQLDQLIVEKEPGEMLTLSLVREGKEIEVDVTTYPYKDYYGNTLLGVFFEEVFETSKDENIEWQNIENLGGPSAGLMITLTLLDKMMEESLLKGNAVAGTGTITIDGEVGPIGGVKQKVIGAANAGFDYFIVPLDGEWDKNESIARKTISEEGLDIELIPVGTIEDAVDALEKLPEKKGRE
ncbi:S16 family serine protease [Sutcliffiella horikoshii]|uniref:S16 family serine protease n=1 Tax=Sutcliffiella horikoshii TaxID=79883 RepID=UPI001CFDCDD7|nr:S16 family serine protease [Sutcliffiella horikoshii]